MAARAFNFFREGSPWLRTWASLARLVCVLLCGVTAAKCALMSGDVLVFLFFLAGPDPLSGRAVRVAISSSVARVWGFDPSSPLVAFGCVREVSMTAAQAVSLVKS
jgi:hypothetical protein